MMSHDIPPSVLSVKHIKTERWYVTNYVTFPANIHIFQVPQEMYNKHSCSLSFFIYHEACKLNLFLFLYFFFFVGLNFQSKEHNRTKTVYFFCISFIKPFKSLIVNKGHNTNISEMQRIVVYEKNLAKFS